MKNGGRVGVGCRTSEDFNHLVAWLSAPCTPTAMYSRRGKERRCGVEEGDPTCDRKQDEQPDPLHVTLPLWRAATGYFVQDLVFP